MPLPPRAFFTIQETAIRWGCSLDELAGWAAVGKLDIAMAIQPVHNGAGVMSGFVAVPVTDILGLFRSSGGDLTRRAVRRIRPLGQEDWIWLTGPADPIEVSLDDLLIMSDDVHQFETDHDVLRRSTVTGAPNRYDWEGLFAMLIRRVHFEGVPATQAELIAIAQEWFAENSPNGEVPDERTLRRRLGPIWRSLQGDA
jgi:hypothetical protein|tara:strand:- start:1284 stop:1877 length:594 start_codon:yes stop_codon:yes gene_type:complete